MPSPLRLYNTLTRSKDELVPLDRKAVRLYVCGPTVWDYAHIGNARPVVVFDVLYRLLRHRFGAGHVVYARNITDVDDKINARAARDFPDMPLNDAIRRVTQATTRQFHEDIAALGCLPPDHEPRATEHIDGMKAMIERLVARGDAYVAEGHVLFSPARMGRQAGMPRYGALSRRTLDEMLAGARVDVAHYKRDPMDFVLWKPSMDGQPGWPSPCGIAGNGRPGWHIECSAMSMAKLLVPYGGGLSCDDPDKNTFDIHGGGVDLVFPHHENEIAQSCCALGTPRMANIWMHNGFLQVEGEKMSKSLGNFVTIRELLTGWRGEPWAGPVLRYAMLGTHYRQPIDWTLERLTQAKGSVYSVAGSSGPNDFVGQTAYDYAWKAEPSPSTDLLAALEDDLNLPEAKSHIEGAISRIAALGDDARAQLVHDMRFLGVMNSDQRPLLPVTIRISSAGTANIPTNLVNDATLRFRDRQVGRANNDVQFIGQAEEWLQNHQFSATAEDGLLYEGSGDGTGSVEGLLAERSKARLRRDWIESDRLRDELAKIGVIIKDNRDGTTSWEVKR